VEESGSFSFKPIHLLFCFVLPFDYVLPPATIISKFDFFGTLKK
jgi:hypothetical protein